MPNFMRTEKSTATLFAFGSLVIGLIALALPAGVVFGAPIRGYTLFVASFGSLAGPFRQWQDCYIALSSLVNVALYLVLPFGVIRGVWLRPLVVVAWLGSAYVVSLPAVVSVATSMAYFAWLLAFMFAAYGFLGLARQQPAA